MVVYNKMSDYMRATSWGQGQTPPPIDVLLDKEKSALQELATLRKIDYYKYLYWYSYYGKQIIRRITLLLNEQDNGNLSVSPFLSSLSRIRIGMKKLDGDLYERELRHDIEQGKRITRKRREGSKKENLLVEGLSNEIPPSANPPYFNKIAVGTEKLETLFNIMKEERWIDVKTSYDDFHYYFSGELPYPKHKLKWRGDKVVLSLLLNNIEYEPEWEVAGNIFIDDNGKPIKSKSLKTMGSKTYADRASNSYFKHNNRIKDLMRGL